MNENNLSPLAPPRWEQRFGNFSIAFFLMEEFLKFDIEKISDIEIEGGVHRFKFSFDMAVKVMADFLEFQGVELELVAPRDIIKNAFAAKLIADGETWIEVLDMRRHISHFYDVEMFRKFLLNLQDKYFNIFVMLYKNFSAALASNDGL